VLHLVYTQLCYVINIRSLDTSKWRPACIRYVLEIDTSWIIMDTYPRSIKINYLILKNIWSDAYKILHKYTKILIRYFKYTYMIEFIKKWDNVVKIHWQCIWFNFIRKHDFYFYFGHMYYFLKIVTFITI